MFLSKDHSFEPRIGTAQLVFGIIYALITAIALVMAVHIHLNTLESPMLQFFMSFLFFILTLKSFFIYFRIKSLIKHGVPVNAKLISCEAVRGITNLKAVYDVKDYGEIEIMTRLAGEKVSHEIKHYLEDHKTSLVPALIVGMNSKHPRGMIMIRTVSGRLDENTMKLNAETSENNEDNLNKNDKNDVQSTANKDLSADKDSSNS